MQGSASEISGYEIIRCLFDRIYRIYRMNVYYNPSYLTV